MALIGIIRAVTRIQITQDSKIICNIHRKCPNYRIRLVYYSKESDPEKKKKPSNLSTYVLRRYTDYIKNFENILSKRFPKAMTVYRGFMDGVTLFYQDVKQYLKILKDLNANGKFMHELTRQELEIYNRVPKEMIKLAPVLVGSALPMGYTFLLPLAYYFPKTLMTEHFWTPAQRKKFETENMVNRVKQSCIVVRMLTSHCINQQSGTGYDQLWIVVQNELKMKQFMYPHKLIGCIDLFKGPFNLDKLSRFHIIHLAKLHDINTFWFPKKALRQRAQIILAMDKAIIKEGGIKHLTLEDMRKVCRLRGLYADDLDVKIMKEWLNKWMHLSTSSDNTSLSFILHASAILGYNEPSNKKLLETAGNPLVKLRLRSRAALKPE